MNSGRAGELLDLNDEGARSRAIGRIVTPVSVQNSPIGRQDKVTAELEHVFPSLASVGPPAGEDKAKVADKHATAEEHRPVSTVQSEVPIGSPFRVAYGGQG